MKRIIAVNTFDGLEVIPLSLTIKRLDETSLNDFLHFFDDTAFCDNPDWAGCYCYFFYIPDDHVWLKRTKNQNRSDAISRIRAGALNGFLAYVDGAPVGWCNADATINFPRIIQNPSIEVDSEKKAASVVCFTIGHKNRNQGIAGKLLEAACQKFDVENYDYIEADPRRSPKTEAEDYYGPLSMYRSRRFTIHQELDGFYIVRRFFNRR